MCTEPAAEVPPNPLLLQPVPGLEKTFGEVAEDNALTLMAIMLNPVTSSRVRASTRRCLEMVSLAVGRPISGWLAKILKNLHGQSTITRRMLPLKVSGVAIDVHVKANKFRYN